MSAESPAGFLVRDACARHLRDLADGEARGIHFDVEAAARVISFFRDVLRLNGGEHEGKPFVLLPWQEFIVGSIFGWKNEEGFRRFRMAFVLTGKGSGKSPISAGIGLYCLMADGEPRAEVYAAASKRDQAQILFRDAVAMFRQSPILSSRLTPTGGPGKENNLAYLATGSFFRTIASEDGQSGPRPHCALLDEIHEHRDNHMVEMLRAGTKGRRQALLFGITNAEASREGVCADYRTYSAKVCSGALIDDAFFAYVAGLDPGDDPFADEACWPKANPSLGHTFGMRYLREQVTQARGMPSKEALVRRLNFCEPTDASAPWVDRDLWDAAEADDWTVEDCIGLPCYGGLDLSAKRDLTALGLCWELPGGLYRLAVFAWTPGDTAEERGRTDNVPYLQWSKEGHLFTPPGRIIDKEYVARFVQQIAGKHDLRSLAFDNAQADDFQMACDDIGFEVWIDDRKRDEDGTPEGPEGDGLRMVRHGQGFAGYQSQSVLWMPRSISHLEEVIMKRRISILRNPVLRWNSASAVLLSDSASNRKWDKRKSTGRIDMMLGGTMAIGAAKEPQPEAAPSIWDRGDEFWGKAKTK